MGFAKYYEDVSDQYWESVGLGSDLGPRAVCPPASPYDRVRKVINELWVSYRQMQPEIGLPCGRWEQPFRHVEHLPQHLPPIATLHENAPAAWETLTAVEQILRQFFRATDSYGPLSRSVIERV